MVNDRMRLCDRKKGREWRGRQTDRQTHRQTDTQTDRHIDRQTDRQTDRHIDRQTHRWIQIGMYINTDNQELRHRQTGR